MTEHALLFFIGSLVLSLGVWVVPRPYARSAAAAYSACFIGVVAPASLIWLAAVIGVTYSAIWIGDLTGRKSVATGVAVFLITVLLFTSREAPLFVWIGGAYFTLRNIHVLLEDWYGRITGITLVRLLHYNLFLPVLIAGPIHRLPAFERQWQRRRYSVQEMLCGAERALFGTAQVVVLGTWLIRELRSGIEGALANASGFVLDWLNSALEWIALYFVFAGYSSIAIGLALMMGLVLEENFNQPYKARTLIDFWSRWHMTLSFWCRDYVFQPVSTLTRSPLIGLVAAMLVIGLWHETSAYYVLWAIWQSIGIAFNQLLLKRTSLSFGSADRILGPLAVLGWLSLAKPVLSRLLDFGGLS